MGIERDTNRSDDWVPQRDKIDEEIAKYERELETTPIFLQLDTFANETDAPPSSQN